MATADLNKLMERVALGDRRAFLTLYGETCGKLFALSLRILQDRAEAESAMQDAYIKIWRYAERFPAAEASAITWMMAITRNICIDRLRAQRSEVATLEVAEAVADGTLRADGRTLTRAHAKRLLECIDNLGESAARTVRIAYFGGATYGALAQREGVPVTTVKSRMRKALADLRSCLAA